MKNVLHDLIRARSDEIVARARVRAALRSDLSSNETDESIRFLLDQLCEARLPPARRMLMLDAARAHGGRLASVGFSASQVVHSYGDICQTVMELALEMNSPIAAGEFRAFSLLLDEAIASAVVGYGLHREATMVRAATERVTTLALTFQNGLFTAMAARDALTDAGAVGDGNMEVLLDQSLQRLQNLLDQPLEGRTGTRVLDRERILLPGLIREATLGASGDAGRRGIAFFEPLPSALICVLSDRQLLVAVIAKMVRHALRMTPRGGRVAVTVREGPGSVSIDVETERAPRRLEQVDPPGDPGERAQEHRHFVHRLWPITNALGVELTLREAAQRSYVLSLVLQTCAADCIPAPSAPAPD